MVWTEDEARAFRARKQLWRVSTLGMELVASIVGMFLLGWLIDHWIGSDGHTFKLIGLGVGFIGGFWNFFKEVAQLRKNPEAGMGSGTRRKPAEERRGPAATPKAEAPARRAAPPAVPAEPGKPRRPGRDPQLFAREHFTDEQLERIEAEGEIRWPEGFEASPDDALGDVPDDEPPAEEDRPR